MRLITNLFADSPGFGTELALWLGLVLGLLALNAAVKAMLAVGRQAQ
jgi:hypothetical protein